MINASHLNCEMTGGNGIFTMQELGIFFVSNDMESYNPKSFTFLYSMHVNMVNSYLKANTTLYKTSKVEQVIPKCRTIKNQHIDTLCANSEICH